MSENAYSNCVAALRRQVKDMMVQAEKKRLEARNADLVASTIYDQAVSLDLLVDRIEKAAQAGPSA